MMRALAGSIAALGEIIVLAAQAVLRIPSRPLETRQILRQIYVQGNRAVGLLLLMAGFVGLVVAYQVGLGLERFGALDYIGQLSALSLLREMVPVLSALVLGGRICAGIAAELGSMVATEQVEAVRALGADPVKKLVMPRLIASTLVLPAFTVIGDLVGGFAAMVVSRLAFHVPMRSFLAAVGDTIAPADFFSGIIKAAVFGFLGGAIACRAGLRSHGGTDGVGRATTSAVVQASLTVVIADFVMTRLMAGWVQS